MSQGKMNIYPFVTCCGNYKKFERLLNFYGMNNFLSLSECYYLLVNAILHNDTGAAKPLISSNCRAVDSENADPETTTPLLIEAIKKTDTKIVDMLLNSGACIDVTDDVGKTPLYHAMERFIESIRTEFVNVTLVVMKPNGSPDTTPYENVVCVSDRKAIVNTCCIDSFLNDLVQEYSIRYNILTGGAYINRVRTSSNFPVYRSLHYSSCATGGKEELIIKITPGASLDIVASDEDLTKFFLDGSSEEEKIVTLLLEHGANVDEYYYYIANDAIMIRRSVLEFAVESACSRLVESVLKSQPKVNYETNRNSLKLAVYLMAVMVRSSREKCHLDMRQSSYGTTTISNTNNTITHHAIKEYARIIESLLKYGFTVDPKDAHDRQFLASSIATGFINIVEDLLKYDAEDVDMLDTAIEMQQTAEMIDLLIRYGADINAKQHGRKAPIWYAIKNIDIDMTKMLLDRGATVMGNASILNIAVEVGSKEIVDILLNHVPDIDINAVAEKGFAALHYTAAARRKESRYRGFNDDDDDNNNNNDDDERSVIDAKREIARTLLNRGARVDARTRTGFTALIIAAMNQRTKLIEDLLKFHADADSIDNRNGNTALHIAIYNSDPATVNILVKYGVNVNVQNDDGETALHVACELANPKIVEILLSCDADVNIASNQNRFTPALLAKHELEMEFTMYDNLESLESIIVFFAQSKISALLKIIDMLRYRLMKMIALNLYICEENLCWFRENASGSAIAAAAALAVLVDARNGKDCLELCREECEKMKKETIGDSNVRYHDILANGANRVAMYARNKSIVRTLESFYQHHREFPMYAKMIDDHFKRGQRKLVLYKLSSRILCRGIIFQRNLPEVVVRKVLGYLLDEDLNNFITAFHERE